MDWNVLSVIRGICPLDCKCLYTHMYICRDKIMNDAEEYVMLLRWREEEREREGCYCKWLRVGELSKWLYACE